jgi:predicted nucleic acid-binding protein
MAALDTNVVIRLLVGDDPRQTSAAQALVAGELCHIAPSVLMECEWVLRGSYGVNREVIADAFADLLKLHNLAPSEPALTARTLRAFAAGLDFADALHAAQCHEGQSLATFDKALARRAPKAGLTQVQLLKA